MRHDITNPPPNPGEVPLKCWILTQAQACGKNARTVYMAFYRGKFPGLKLRRVNQRVIYVRLSS